MQTRIATSFIGVGMLALASACQRSNDRETMRPASGESPDYQQTQTQAPASESAPSGTGALNEPDVGSANMQGPTDATDPNSPRSSTSGSTTGSGLNSSASQNQLGGEFGARDMAGGGGGAGRSGSGSGGRPSGGSGGRGGSGGGMMR